MRIRAKCLEIVLKGMKLGASITILGIFLLGFVTAYDMVRNYRKERDTKRDIIIVSPTIKLKWYEESEKLEIAKEVLDEVFMVCHNKIEKETNKTIIYSNGLKHVPGESLPVDSGLPDYTTHIDVCVLEMLISSNLIHRK